MVANFKLKYNDVLSILEENNNIQMGSKKKRNLLIIGGAFLNLNENLFTIITFQMWLKTK